MINLISLALKEPFRAWTPLISGLRRSEEWAIGTALSHEVNLTQMREGLLKESLIVSLSIVHAFLLFLIPHYFFQRSDTFWNHCKAPRPLTVAQLPQHLRTAILTCRSKKSSSINLIQARNDPETQSTLLPSVGTATMPATGKTHEIPT